MVPQTELLVLRS